MYTKANGDFIGVAAANDGLGGAAISVLDRNGEAGKIPVTGQDATDEGLQRVLLGTQCMTVYKAVKEEADAAAELADRAVEGRGARDRSDHSRPGVGPRGAVGAAGAGGHLQGQRQGRRR
jgi:ABC-type xylose transport system substrate-binding protein